MVQGVPHHTPKHMLLLEVTHAPSRSHSRGFGRLSATVYGSDVEKTDDFVDWHTAGSWASHPCRWCMSWAVGSPSSKNDNAEHLPGTYG